MDAPAVLMLLVSRLKVEKYNERIVVVMVSILVTISLYGQTELRQIYLDKIQI
jgi:hypothetical protein